MTKEIVSRALQLQWHAVNKSPSVPDDQQFDNCSCTLSICSTRSYALSRLISSHLIASELNSTAEGLLSCSPGAVLRERERTGGPHPSQRSAPTVPPPNKIFGKCNWTPGMKILWFYVGFMSKIAYLYIWLTKCFFFPVTTFPFKNPAPTAPSKWKCWNCPSLVQMRWNEMRWEELYERFFATEICICCYNVVFWELIRWNKKMKALKQVINRPVWLLKREK